MYAVHSVKPDDQDDPDSPQPRPRSGRGGSARRRRRSGVAEHAQARSGVRRGADGALQARRQPPSARRRHDRCRLRRDRAARRDGLGLEDRHAPARALGPRGPLASPLGGRPDGVAREPRSPQPAPPQRDHGVPARSRLPAARRSSRRCLRWTATSTASRCSRRPSRSTLRRRPGRWSGGSAAGSTPTRTRT